MLISKGCPMSRHTSKHRGEGGTCPGVSVALDEGVKEMEKSGKTPGVLDYLRGLLSVAVTHAEEEEHLH